MQFIFFLVVPAQSIVYNVHIDFEQEENSKKYLHKGVVCHGKFINRA